jgi:hypothetical protein
MVGNGFISTSRGWERKRETDARVKLFPDRDNHESSDGQSVGRVSSGWLSVAGILDDLYRELVPGYGI